MHTQKAKVAVADTAVRIIRAKGGIIRTSDALKAGVHPRTLYALRDNGTLEQLTRGVYRLTDGESLSEPDLVTVATRIPKAVVCLVSALAFHELTTQIPHAVSIALEKGAKSPVLEYPPIAIHHFSKEAFLAGIEQREIDGVSVRIYSVEKTLVDCFKFRNKIGMDIFLEALQLYRKGRKLRISELLESARICRVERPIMPYLEATL